MTRTLRRFALVAAGAVALPGCAVSLFSDDQSTYHDDEERIAVLERRVDEVERRLPPK